MPVHLRSLTSLRFFAAALVVLYHAAVQSSPGALSQDYALLRFGYLGVTFFFVLSGFVLVWSAQHGDSARSFYRRRFARIWPVHALTLALAVLLGGLAVIHHRGPSWSAPLNAVLLQAWARDGEVVYGYNGVSWSLSGEAFFYAMFPLLYVAARRLGPRVTIGVGSSWLLLGGLIAEVTQDGWWAGVLPAYRIGEFVVGMGLAQLVRCGVWRVNPRVAWAVLSASYGALVVANRLTSGDAAGRSWLAALIVMPGIALLLVALAGRDIEDGGGWLARPELVRLGQWSFALYMVHELVLRAARPAMLEHMWFIPVAVLASVAAAGVIYEFFERPMERRLRGGSRSAAHLAPTVR